MTAAHKYKNNSWISAALIISAAAILFSCTKAPGITRVTSADNTGIAVQDSEGLFTIRSISADITAETLSDEELNVIMKKPPFTVAKSDDRMFRVPRFSYFFLTVKNTGSEHVTVKSISLSCGEKKFTHLTPAQFKEQTKSPAFKSLDADAFLARRRIMVSGSSVKKINFETGAPRYNFEFTAPGDTVMTPLVFEWIPAECRNYILSAVIKTSGGSRPVEFHMSRAEYRTKGNNFRRKIQEEK